jgi:hypothetical protein
MRKGPDATRSRERWPAGEFAQARITTPSLTVVALRNLAAHSQCQNRTVKS